MSSSVVESPVADTVDQLIANEEQAFLRRQPRSTELIAVAGEHLAGGATSNWQIAQPQAVWMSHGKGSKVYDVDGNEYVDMHGGYGASIAGHAHPAIVEAVSDRVRRGTHFAQPTEDAIWIAGELARRFDLPLWRFANSGTEATMDAVHLARALTGRDLIIKVEGCYHGHHDSVQVSVLPEADEVGPRDHPTAVPGNSGIPAAIRDLVIVVPFNDAEAVARALGRAPRTSGGDDPRTGDDERRHHPARRRLSRGHPRPGARRGRVADLRRGEDRLHHRTGRRHRAAAAWCPTWFAWPRRSAAASRSRRSAAPDSRDVGDRRRPLRAGRHVQRQPAGDGGHPRHAHRRAHPAGLRTPRASSRPGCAPPWKRSSRNTVSLARRRRVGAKGCVTFRRDRVREFRDFLRDRCPTRPLALADAAQWRCVSPAVGEGGAMAVVGSARRRTMSTGSPPTSPGSPRRWRPDRVSVPGEGRRDPAGRAGQVVRRRARRDGYRPETYRPASSTRCSARPVAARPRRCA